MTLWLLGRGTSSMTARERGGKDTFPRWFSLIFAHSRENQRKYARKRHDWFHFRAKARKSVIKWGAPTLFTGQEPPLERLLIFCWLCVMLGSNGPCNHNVIWMLGQRLFDVERQINVDPTFIWHCGYWGNTVRAQRRQLVHAVRCYYNICKYPWLLQLLKYHDHPIKKRLRPCHKHEDRNLTRP